MTEENKQEDGNTLWTPQLITTAMGRKQAELSDALRAKPEEQKKQEMAKRAFEMKDAELRLKYEYDEKGERISDNKILARIRNNVEYQTAWAEFIIAKSKYAATMMAIKRLSREMKTLEGISMQLMAEMKALRWTQETDGQGNTRPR